MAPNSTGVSSPIRYALNAYPMSSGSMTSNFQWKEYFEDNVATSVKAEARPHQAWLDKRVEEMRVRL